MQDATKEAEEESPEKEKGRPVKEEAVEQAKEVDQDDLKSLKEGIGKVSPEAWLERKPFCVSDKTITI